MDTQLTSLQSVVQSIKTSQTLVLSTHRQCDGDGLGCELALFFALKKTGKDVRVINLDSTPKKYSFLNPDQFIQYYDKNPQLPKHIDLVLFFDTNDIRLLQPLYGDLSGRARNILFIDHHPLLKKGPTPPQAHINTEAASTGELVYKIIKELGIPLDVPTARALYTSIVFDTQLFRFIRNSPASHLIAAELLGLPIDAEEIHRHLFSHQTPQKVAFMAKVFSKLEYFGKGAIAFVTIFAKDLESFGLTFDEVRDITDQIMSINSIEVAVVVREETDQKFRVSMRSKGVVEVLSTAEKIGGGGHWYAAGGSFSGGLAELKTLIIESLSHLLNVKT